MNSRRIEDLVPELQKPCEEFIYQCQAKGLAIVLTSTARDYKIQFALFAQGRESLKVVNEYRRLAGLPPISEAENQHCVTWILKSKHLVNLDDQDPKNDKARAFDFALLSAGHAHWNIKADFNADNIPDYLEAGIIAESLGLEWGGRWPKPDWPHVQLRS